MTKQVTFQNVDTEIKRIELNRSFAKNGENNLSLREDFHLACLKQLRDFLANSKDLQTMGVKS